MQPTKAQCEATAQSVIPETGFSLSTGGPLYQLYLHTGLARPVLELVARRAVCLSLLCWLPLFFLSLIEGHALRGVSLPFLLDIGVHTRFLLALPLLIGAELIVHERSGSVVRQFLTRGIVPPSEQAHYGSLVQSAIKLRNSAVVEVALAVLAVATARWVWTQPLAAGESNWYAGNGGAEWSTAGYWYLYVSSSILRFLLLRWYFRIFLWYRLLWRIRGLELNLNLLHPDRAAGLGFLEESVVAFAPVMAAQTILIAGTIGNRIWHAGASFTTFKMVLVFAVVFLILLVLTPLSFFIAQLARAARTARREYGLLASHYVEDFRHKWIVQQGDSGDTLLGTGDIQSLADLGNAYDVISHMRVLPFGKEAVARLVILVVLPLVPIALTTIPLQKIVERFIKLVL